MLQAAHRTTGEEIPCLRDIVVDPRPNTRSPTPSNDLQACGRRQRLVPAQSDKQPGIMKPASRSGKARAAQNARARIGLKQRTGASAPSVDSRSSAVRIIEDGVDLTPLPLVLPSWKLNTIRSSFGDLEKSKPLHATTEKTLPSNEELGATEILSDGDYGTDDDATKHEDEDEDVVQYLVESKTEMLLHIAGVCVATDFVGKAGIEGRNAAYDTMLAERSFSDRFVIRHCQTINLPDKEQGCMALPPKTREVSCQSTSWDIYDANAGHRAATDSEDNEDPKAAAQKVLTSRWQAEMNKTVSVALASPDFLLDVSEAKVQPTSKISPSLPQAKDALAAAAAPTSADLGSQQVVVMSAEELLRKQRSEKILASHNLAAALARMERCVQQNLFHAKQLRYRDRISASEIQTSAHRLQEGAEAAETQMGELTSTTGKWSYDAAEEPSARLLVDEHNGGVMAGEETEAGFEELWSWSAPMTHGRCVTGMSWNHVNQDVLAVGYGDLSCAARQSGLVLFWSLRNPVYPERILTLSSGCTALNFSRTSPQLLAVGMREGAVAVYDVRHDEHGILAAPVLDSENTPGKHMEPVWQVQWINKGNERGESLISISTDGRVVEWSMKKGLEESTLMVLKRVGSSEGVISRQASGLCFDFPIDDSSIYLAGTEDGLVHRCSCSYNEQYLETYSGHTGPVYRIRCSPFWPPAFLSCSADWTVKLWHQKSSEPVHSFQSVDLSDVVHDVAWSPRNATVYASVAGDGRVEIWDLTHSTLDPIIRQFPHQNRNDGDDRPVVQKTPCQSGELCLLVVTVIHRLFVTQAMTPILRPRLAKVRHMAHREMN